jgi:hypothetical protein
MITEFPNYSVSDTGFVRNEDTGYVMTGLRNQRGIVHVGLTRDRVLFKRSVSRLVAEAFIAIPAIDTDGTFDTPINLDGDRSNNHVDNLMWRPRWFAMKYRAQFEGKRKISLNRPIELIETKEVYSNSWHAATTLGLLDYEILMSIVKNTYVWPLYRCFRPA